MQGVKKGIIATQKRFFQSFLISTVGQSWCGWFSTSIECFFPFPHCLQRQGSKSEREHFIVHVADTCELNGLAISQQGLARSGGEVRTCSTQDTAVWKSVYDLHLYITTKRLNVLLIITVTLRTHLAIHSKTCEAYMN